MGVQAQGMIGNHKAFGLGYEALAFFTRVRAKYLALAAAEPRRFRVLDATLSPAALKKFGEQIL